MTYPKYVVCHNKNGVTHRSKSLPESIARHEIGHLQATCPSYTVWLEDEGGNRIADNVTAEITAVFVPSSGS